MNKQQPNYSPIHAEQWTDKLTLQLCNSYFNTLCRLVAVYRRFGSKHWVNLQGRSTFLRKNVTYRHARLSNNLQYHQQTKPLISDPAVPSRPGTWPLLTRPTSQVPQRDK